MATRPKKKLEPKPAPTFESLYPYVAAWVEDGWVEIGASEYLSGFVNAIDHGGLIFEGKPRRAYTTLDEAFRDLNEGIKRACKEMGIDLGIEDE